MINPNQIPTENIERVDYTISDNFIPIPKNTERKSLPLPFDTYSREYGYDYVIVFYDPETHNPIGATLPTDLNPQTFMHELKKV